MDNNFDFAKELIDTALKGEHTKQERINNYNEYRAAFEVLNAVTKVCDCFANAAKQEIDAYLKDDNVAHLFQSRTMEYCKDFYEEEIRLTGDTIEEYRNYLYNGHFLAAFVFGEDRNDTRYY